MIALAIHSASGAETRRVWNSKSGKFKVEADFVGIEGEEVLLKKVDNGKIIRVKFADLKPADLKAARELAASEENPFAGNGPNTGGWVDSTPGGNAGAVVTADRLAIIDSPGRSTVEKIELVYGEGWNYRPDPEPASRVKLKAAMPIPQPKRPAKDAWEKRMSISDRVDDGIMIWPRGEYVGMLRNYTLDRGDNARGPLLVRCDLASGKPKGFSFLGLDVAPKLASPDGRFVIGFRESDRELLVLSLDERGGARLCYRWVPLEQSEHISYRRELSLIGNDRAVVRSNKGDLDIWQVKPDKATLQFTISTDRYQNGWGVSRGGKYLAVSQKGSTFIIDVVAGRTVGQLSTGSEQFTVVSFSPDGKQLALANYMTLVAFDLETQAPIGGAHFPKIISPETIEFPSRDLLLVNASHLVSLSKNVVVWRYTAPKGLIGQPPQWHDGSYWYAARASNGDNVIARAKIPHEEALEAAEKANSDLYALTAGGKVALVVNDTGPDRNEIIRGITENLQKVGIEVVPSANIAFVCETEMGKSKSVSYGSVLQGARTISVTERTHSIRLMDGTKKIWEAGVPHDAPGTIVPPPGSTIEQELARLMNSSKNYFLSIRFPSKFVRYPDGQVSLGTSEVSLGLP